VLTYEAIATGVREDVIVDAALAAIPAPTLEVVGRAA
jgi:hypothetical protein